MNRRLAIVAALAFIAAATLIPSPADRWQHEFWCFRCGGSVDPLELVLNVLLFVPLGLALRASRVRATVALAVVVATTVSVEVLQYVVIVGREGALRDCLTNTVGGIAGYALQPHLGALWRADGRPTRRLAWAGALAWAIYAALTALLFRPAGTSERYYSQVAPELGQFDTFPGRVLSAEIDGARVYSEMLTPVLQARMQLEDSIGLSAVVVPGRATSHVAPILNVVDAATEEIANLAQQGSAAAFQARVMAQNVGLNSPAVFLGDVFGKAAGDNAAPMRLTGVRRGMMLTIRETSSNGATRVATLVLSPSLGWSLWWPRDFPGRATLLWMTVAWLVLPVAAIGFWSLGRRRHKAGRGSALGVVADVAPPVLAVLAAQVVVPLVLGPWIVSRSDVLIAGAGALGGLTLGWLRSAARGESLVATPDPTAAPERARALSGPH